MTKSNILCINKLQLTVNIVDEVPLLQFKISACNSFYILFYLASHYPWATYIIFYWLLYSFSHCHFFNSNFAWCFWYCEYDTWTDWSMCHTHSRIISWTLCTWLQGTHARFILAVLINYVCGRCDEPSNRWQLHSFRNNTVWCFELNVNRLQSACVMR